MIGRGLPRRLAVLVLLLPAAPIASAAPPADRDLWFVVVADPARRAAVVAAAEADLARTPQRHPVRFASRAELPRPWPRPVLAAVEVRFDGRAVPRLDLARAEAVVTPGWLVHALLRGLEAAGSTARVAGEGPWPVAQLVARSSRTATPGAADAALAGGAPAVVLRLPASVGESAAAHRIAAVARRLDGLEGWPSFEDEYLVLAGRVWLRRDLYWLGLVLWVPLFWRGRRRHRLFRWLFLVAWWATPAFSAVLLTLPAVVGVAFSEARAGWRIAACAPCAWYAVQLGAALAGGARPVVSLVPAAIVVAALAAFAGGFELPGPRSVRVDAARDERAAE